MKNVFWIKGERGLICVKKAIDENMAPILLVLQPQPGKKWYERAHDLSKMEKLQVLETDNPNSNKIKDKLISLKPDCFILAGYGIILKQDVIDIPKLMTINLHGGKLPGYKGSSPMNWALINGDRYFSITIIKVNAGIDTGDILMERSFSISPDDTIIDLHAKANTYFPEMLIKVLSDLEKNLIIPHKQQNEDVSYYPMRFPDDGLILWDMKSAEEIHNRIRALTTPYPCAYTYYKGRKIKLVQSKLKKNDFYGEPGRVYQIRNNDMLICAKDKCLWITKAVMDDDDSDAFNVVQRYERMATVSLMAESFFLR